MNLLRERGEDGVEVLRVDRPTKRNALNSATLRQLAGDDGVMNTGAGVAVGVRVS